MQHKFEQPDHQRVAYLWYFVLFVILQEPQRHFSTMCASKAKNIADKFCIFFCGEMTKYFCHVICPQNKKILKNMYNVRSSLPNVSNVTRFCVNFGCFSLNERRTFSLFILYYYIRLTTQILNKKMSIFFLFCVHYR